MSIHEPAYYSTMRQEIKEFGFKTFGGWKVEEYEDEGFQHEDPEETYVYGVNHYNYEIYGQYDRENTFLWQLRQIQNLFHINKDKAVMGGVQSRAQMITRFNKINPQKWDIVRKEGLTQIAVDSTGREGEVNVIKLDPLKTPQKELEVYYYRRTFDAPLVKCYGAESLKSTSGGVCGTNNTMKVITERIIKRWGELPQLTFPETLYSLKQALSGYSALFKEVGAFQVNRNMLGINNQGDLHVWLNENFADNNPSLEKGILYTTNTASNLDGVGTEREMINNILQLVQQKCEQGKYPQDFSQVVFSKNQKFEDIIDTVDDYIENKNIAIPSKIHPDNKKMYVSKVRRIQVLSGSKAVKQPEAKFSPSKNDFLTFNNQRVEQSVYVKKDTKQNNIMTPRHANFGTPEGKFSTDLPSSSYGYQTGPITTYETQKFTDLRLNPNIDATQSIYEPNKTPQSSYLNSNEVSGYKASFQKSPATKPYQISTRPYQIPKNPQIAGSQSKTGNFTFNSGAIQVGGQNTYTNPGFTTFTTTGNTGNIYTANTVIKDQGKFVLSRPDSFSPGLNPSLNPNFNTNSIQNTTTVISSSPEVKKTNISFNYKSSQPYNFTEKATTTTTTTTNTFKLPDVNTKQPQAINTTTNQPTNIKKQVMQTSQVTKQY